MRIGSVEIGPQFPCRIVAEISNAHNGDMYRAFKLLWAAKEAGADLIKLQAYTAAELVALRGDVPAPEPWGSQGWSMLTLYEKAQTPLEWLPALFAEAQAHGIPMFASVFGLTSLTALRAVDCPAYKISHFECANDDLACLVRSTGKPVIISRSTPTSRVSHHYWTGDVFHVLCPGGYPAVPTDLHIGNWGLASWGLSSHCRDPLVAPLAVARGAKYLEYHFHLEAEPSELEANVSLNEREFAAMVASVRQAEVLLG